MKKLLKIKTPNKVFNFKQKQVRTPAIVEATDGELKFLLVAMKAAGVTDYTINEKKETLETSIEDPIEVEEEKEVIIEELDDLEPESMLEKLASEKKEKEWKK